MQPDAQVEAELFTMGTSVTQGINFDMYDKIPVEVSGNNVPAAWEDFSKCPLNKKILDNIDRMGFKKPTPVQKHSVPAAVARRDLMSCAQTGSGKTAAFLLPVIHVILRDMDSKGGTAHKGGSGYGGGGYNRRSRSRYMPHALILSPTRELTQQIHKEARKFCYLTGVRPCVVYGGADIREQFRELDKGVELLVATPGRLVDFMDRGNMSMAQCSFVVLDEADRMLDMGFEPQIQQILDDFDMPQDRQMMMFSATFPREIQLLAQKYLSDYVFLAVGRVGSTTESITQKLLYAEGQHQKVDSLMQLLPKCDGLTLIFVATRRDADRIEDFLRDQGVHAEAIHGNRTQHERERALNSFRNGESPILVATDVAARGLDIPNVMWVINYDLPSSIDSYIHRIGRTGRCGNTGNAISLVTNRENKNVLKELLKILEESKQETPAWFTRLVDQSNYSSYGGGGNYGGGRRSKSNYGGRDIRKENGGSGGGPRTSYNGPRGGFGGRSGRGGGGSGMRSNSFGSRGGGRGSGRQSSFSNRAASNADNSW